MPHVDAMFRKGELRPSLEHFTLRRVSPPYKLTPCQEEAIASGGGRYQAGVILPA